MRLPARGALVAGVILMLAAGQLPAQTQPKSTTTSKQHTSAKSKGRRYARKGSWKRHGQQGIQAERAREIQEALIREHYLTGQPTGIWDARSKEAMTRYQSDNGWQTKITPDSRALIKLGLGPNYADKDMYKATSAAAASPSSTSTRQ